LLFVDIGCGCHVRVGPKIYYESKVRIST
jgi:hypothetical protein